MQIVVRSVLCFAVALSALVGAVGCQSGGGGDEAPVAPAAVPQAFSYADWQKVLSAVVTPDGYIRWDVVQSDDEGVRKPLLKFIGLINLVSPENHPELFPTQNDRLAYWINAYNATTMYAVVWKKYPGTMLSGNPPGEIFTVDKFTFAGEATTLDDLTRRVFAKADAKIYFALNQCAVSSPPLRTEPYDGGVLDAQLVDQGQRYLSDPRAVVRNGDTAELNDLLLAMHRAAFIAQFQKLIGRPPTSILEALQPYALGDSPIVGATKVGQLGFDWTLNRPPR